MRVFEAVGRTSQAGQPARTRTPQSDLLATHYPLLATSPNTTLSTEWLRLRHSPLRRSFLPRQVPRLCNHLPECHLSRRIEPVKLDREPRFSALCARWSSPDPPAMTLPLRILHLEDTWFDPALVRTLALAQASYPEVPFLFVSRTAGAVRTVLSDSSGHG